jgi:hypothetical protein
MKKLLIGSKSLKNDRRAKAASAAALWEGL